MTAAIDVRRAADRVRHQHRWLDSQALVLVRPALRPGQHPPRAAAGQQRRRRRAGHRLRDPPAPRHGDRHLGAARVAGAPGLHRAHRRDLPGPGAADERRHRHPALGEERLLAAAGRTTEHADPVHFVQMWVVPDEDGITPGYEQLEIDDELLSGGLVPVASGMARHDGAAAIRIKNRYAALHAARLQPGQSVTLPEAPFLHLFVAARRGDARGRRRAGRGRRRAVHRDRRPAGDRGRAGRDPGLGDARGPRGRVRGASTMTTEEDAYTRSDKASLISEEQRQALTTARDRIRAEYLFSREHRPPTTGRGVHHVALICGTSRRRSSSTRTSPGSR